MKAKNKCGRGKRKTIAQKFWEKAVITAFLVFVLTQSSYADLVELDLFSIGCKSTYDYDSPSWTSDFDLGVTFTEISHVYIDWEGEITGGLAIDYDDPGNSFPIDVGIASSLGSNPWPRTTDVWGGEETYPSAEVFDYLFEFELLWETTWSDLIDGQGIITIGYGELILSGGEYIEHGTVQLDNASLIFEGTIVPEPTTLLLLFIGAIAIRHRHPNNNDQSIKK